MPKIKVGAVDAMLKMKLPPHRSTRVRDKKVAALVGKPLLAAAVVLLAACQDTEPRTEVVLRVDADAPIRSRTNALRLEIDGYRVTTGATRREQQSVDQTFTPLS